MKIFKYILSIFVALLVFTHSNAAEKWDMALAYGAGNFHSANATEFANNVTKKSNGKLTIVTHPGGSLFKGGEIFRAVRTGQAPIGERFMSALGKEDPLLEIDSLPFLATSYSDAMKLYKASKAEIAKNKLLRKWHLFLNNKKISQLTELDRFKLHQELEMFLPSFVFYLPQNLRFDWLNRWRDKEDKLFHPSNLLNGDVIKKNLKIEDGPILGNLLQYLSKELAYKRLNNFDEAIYKATQWIEQNAPKCD